MRSVNIRLAARTCVFSVFDQVPHEWTSPDPHEPYSNSAIRYCKAIFTVKSIWAFDISIPIKQVFSEILANNAIQKAPDSKLN